MKCIGLIKIMLWRELFACTAIAMAMSNSYIATDHEYHIRWYIGENIICEMHRETPWWNQHWRFRWNAIQHDTHARTLLSHPKTLSV